MSLLRYTSSINSTPALDRSQPFYIFIYDFPNVFLRHFPHAKAKGICIIPEWELHFNQKNRANIRPIFASNMVGFEPVGMEYLMPAPEVKKETFNRRKAYPACGFVFEVNSHDNGIIEQTFAKQQRQRVRCKAWMSPALGQPIDSKAVGCVSAFADLHHTRPGSNPRTFLSQEEHHRWMETVSIYTRYGMPEAVRDFVLKLVNGKVTNMFSPIYINPEAYPIGVTRMVRRLKEKYECERANKTQLPLTAANLQKNDSASNGTIIPAVEAHNRQARIVGYRDQEYNQYQIDKADEEVLPRKAFELRGKYHRKHGILAPACPLNDKQAKAFEDYHDEILRSHADVDFQDEKQFKAAVVYWNRMSERCDDGLDVLDAIKESRGERPWVHPNTLESLDGSEDQETTLPTAAARPAAKKIPKASSNKTAREVQQKITGSVTHKRQRAQQTQNAQLAGQPPAKKQRVQPSGPARAQRNY